MLLLLRKVWFPYGKTQAPHHKHDLFLAYSQDLGRLRESCVSPRRFSASSGVTQSFHKTDHQKRKKKKNAGKCGVLLESLCLGFIPVSRTFSFRRYYAILQSA